MREAGHGMAWHSLLNDGLNYSVLSAALWVAERT